ncbi:hypothetical protein AN643_01955 [Candidatus Epulonipiscioides saccharophilum]|nr:hypothetical protein AN643_01955 [Epulopiscium sp. SCG-B10WGA-EpuloB]
MKLAEALINRASLQSKAHELRSRLENNALVQDGEEPVEDPYELLTEYEEVMDAFENLIAKINLTNSIIKVDGISITEIIAKRDVLKQKLSTYNTFINAASRLVSRHSTSEIKIKSTVNVKEMQKKADQISAQLRKVDMKLQELNWTSELI